MQLFKTIKAIYLQVHSCNMDKRGYHAAQAFHEMLSFWMRTDSNISGLGISPP